MRIAHIVCAFPPYPGGMGNSCFYLSQLSSEEHEVTVFTPAYGKLEEKEISSAKFKIVRIKPWFKFGNAAFTPRLFWLLRDFEAVYLHYPAYGMAEFVLFRRLMTGKKFNLILHYHMDNTARGFKGFIFYLYRILFLPLLLRLAKVIVGASIDYLKHSALSGYYRRNSHKFKQILLGVDLERFSSSRAGGNLENAILFVGGLDKAHYFKGLEILLRAGRLMKDKGLKFSLKIIGGGDLLDYYRKKAEELGVKEETNFFGRLSDAELVKHYGEARVFVLPSVNRSEAFGLVLLEAMAAGRPVIASNLAGVRSVFKNGREGLLVRPGDPRDLAEKIETVLNNKKRAEEMGAAGRKLAREKYSKKRIKERLSLLYHFVKYTP